MTMDIRLPRRISRIEFRCSEQTKAALLSRMQIHEGSMLTDELLQEARAAAEAYDERLAVLVNESLRQEEYLKSGPEPGGTFPASIPDEGVSVVLWDRAMPPQRIRVDGSKHDRMLMEKPMPPRSDHAGVAPAAVKIAILVGKDGRILEAEPLAGPHPLFSPAIAAVRQWKYQPTLLNGRPVEVETTVEIPFAAEK